VAFGSPHGDFYVILQMPHASRHRRRGQGPHAAMAAALTLQSPRKSGRSVALMTQAEDQALSGAIFEESRSLPSRT